ALSDRFQALAQAQAPDREVEFAHGRDVVASSWQLEFHQGRGIEVDALPAYCYVQVRSCGATRASAQTELLPTLDAITFLDLEFRKMRSEEHTSELQSRSDLVCRLL